MDPPEVEYTAPMVEITNLGMCRSRRESAGENGYHVRPVALLQLTNIEKILGDRMIFKDLSFTIDRGERVGLIGDNGSGKTTLFKLITNALQADMGERSIARGTTIGMLDQDPTFDLSNTLIDEAELAFKDLHDLAHDLRDLEHKMGEVEGDELQKVLDKYTDLQHKFEEAGGYAWRHKLEATLHGVGFEDKDFEKPVSALSGGQRSRLALAKLLINPPELLLLDEPTNHLDIAGVEWLEDYLLSYSGAVLVISHDRRLLDKVTNRIVWLTARKLRSYVGNYSAFQTQREVEVLSQGRAHEEQRAAIEKEQEYIRRFGAGQRARQKAPCTTSRLRSDRREGQQLEVNAPEVRHRSTRRRSAAACRTPLDEL
jgi:ATP-binding cassette, subfamily F, member 3